MRKLAPCPDRPNCVCSRASPSSRSYVAPIAISRDPGKAFGRLKTLLAAFPRTEIVAVNDTYVHATCRTLLGFVDDLEASLCAAERAIHVRSASRVGFYDFGVNRGRVEALRRLMAKPRLN